jgi:hypothetical protein
VKYLIILLILCGGCATPRKDTVIILKSKKPDSVFTIKNVKGDFINGDKIVNK